MRIIIFLSILLISLNATGKSIPEVFIKGLNISKKEGNNYTLSFKTLYRGIDPELFSDEKIKLFNEDNIISGNINNSILTERDLLFSQQNIDLNGNSQYNDKFKITKKRGNYSISGKSFNLTRRKIGKSMAFTPIAKDGKSNSIHINKNSVPFNIHFYDPIKSLMTIGIISKEKPIILTGNSIVLIEIISPRDKASNKSKPKIMVEKTFSGLLSIEDDKLITGEPLLRTWGIKEIKNSKMMQFHKINLKNMPSHFKIKITYLFAVSKRIILYSEKYGYSGN